ncbi:MAG: TauD/TfdA family dioxygenase [Novosphingobium sp.]|nr:TauD/TfdA family dioxygenase [Novosphingobium sp.]
MWRTRDLTPRIGTEIRADKATLLSGARAEEILEILERRGVICFRDANLNDEEQRSFSQSLGELIPQGDKGVFTVSMDPDVNPSPEIAEYQKGSIFWHIDTATDRVPTKASILSPRVLSLTGGDTEFANTYAAYEDLPEDEKAQVEQLRVVHSTEAAQRLWNPWPTYAKLKQWQSIPTATHPLVWTHRSGRKSLVLGATASHVVGMELDEGRALLCRLNEWATQPQFVYRHQWEMGDLVMWDNTGVMHRAMPYPEDSGRRMHRTTLVGEESIA